tara:strand:- start:357 stop:908 length:552 start_codon:yes stop_codon:yes gene_type:complete
MTIPNRIFLTGVPGSRWSGIAQEIEQDPRFNTTDRTPDREYTHGEFSGHVGAYFGTGMEFPAILDTKNLDRPYTGNSTKLHKSHEWAGVLDDIVEQYPHAGIVLIYRNDEASLDWWLQAGGFNITYPDYKYYDDKFRMRIEIGEQNIGILRFAQKHKLTWRQHNKHSDVFIATYNIQDGELRL